MNSNKQNSGWNAVLVAGLGLGLTLFVIVLSGCAEERAPIDRVQPLALEKSFFVGEDLLDGADDPEFWSQATLVDVGYGAKQDGLFTSTYAQPMSRIKWQVTEDLLIARLAYERIDDSDGKGTGDATPDGIVVAAFKIDKHFDVTWDYNSTTGEKLNVLEENDVDRPWYERAYMRLDFSENLSTNNYDFDTLSLVGVFGGVTYESLKYYVDDPNHEDAPFFDTSNGYFDVTTKAFATPGVVDLSHLGWGIDSFPACFLDNDFFHGSAPAGSCSPVELTIRHAFRRVVDHDYEPVDWDGYRFQAFGAFTVERDGYARNYGMSDSLWRRFVSRYDIWERSHFYADAAAMTGPVECFTPETTPFGSDPHRDEDGDGTEDECAAVGGGSRCDTFRQRCTLPYRERTPNTIVWYYTEGSHPDYFEASELAAHQWDVALRTAVRTAQYGECVRMGDSECATKWPVYFGQQDDNDDAITLALEMDDCRSGRTHTELGRDQAACAQMVAQLGQARGDSAGVIAIAQMDEMIVLCHSPVEANDPAACGDARLPEGVSAADCALAEETRDQATLATCRQALSVRRGDLRYHQINVIEEPQTPSPWGIYTDAEDPLTGETVSASINVWSHITDLWTQKLVDTMRYIGGELTTEEITEGEWIHKWAQAADAAAGGGGLPGFTAEQVAAETAAFSGAAEGVAIPHTEELDPTLRAMAFELKQELMDVRATFEAPSSLSAVYSARRQHAAGTEFEAELMTPMVQELYGVQGMPLTDGLMNMVSPLRGGNPSLQRQLFHMKENALAERGACIMHEAETPLGLASLAELLQAKFGPFNPEDSLPVQQARAEKMRTYMARRAHMAVIAHEMGHSVGLRHNFVSSADALNYRPQYWQLRTKDGAVSETCKSLTADGSSCVGPRYFDPVTDEEKQNLIWMFMQSSIMDYAGETTQDFIGLGAWDFAAARMFYGDMVAVHADPSYVVGTDRAETALAKVDNFGGILGIQHSFGDESIHYSQLQDKMELIHDCQPVADVAAFQPSRWDVAKDGHWHPTLDGMVVRVNGQFTRCRQQPVDYVSWDELSMPTDDEFSGYFRGDRAVDAHGRVRVPYGFATDRWADLGNLSVYRHDNGADAYELFNFLITQQEVGHIFDNYRRGRKDFSVRGAAERTLSRYNEKMRDGAKGLGLMRNVYQDFALELGWEFDAVWPSLAGDLFLDNILAAGLAFDHFTRLAARPQSGPHHARFGDDVLRSSEDVTSSPGKTLVTLPNGPTGAYGDMAIGGRPVENRLSEVNGEYDSELTVNAGSYYDKLYSSMLLTESVDNFISDSRGDFVDARYRAVSMADLFPDGYRRFLANALTGDDALKGPRVAAAADGKPILDDDGYPAEALGWTSWWGETPRSCFPRQGTTVCEAYGNEPDAWNPLAPAETAIIDPQIGWEQQKFLIAWTLLYLPENQQQTWLNQMRVWELGVDADPGFARRIEFHHPNGRVYIAKTFGKETIFGKEVEKGIAARVLEYANELLLAAYETEPVDNDGDGVPDWYLPVLNEDTGEPIVRHDPTIFGINGGFINPAGRPGCNATDNSTCTCSSNRACLELAEYVSVPAFLRQAMDAYGLVDPNPKGIY